MHRPAPISVAELLNAARHHIYVPRAPRREDRSANRGSVPPEHPTTQPMEDSCTYRPWGQGDNHRTNELQQILFRYRGHIRYLSHQVADSRVQTTGIRGGVVACCKPRRKAPTEGEHQIRDVFDGRTRSSLYVARRPVTTSSLKGR